MQIHSKNKMLGSEEVKNKGSEEYFFSGGLEYIPQTIRADTPEEAEKIWIGTRKKMGESLQEN